MREEVRQPSHTDRPARQRASVCSEGDGCEEARPSLERSDHLSGLVSISVHPILGILVLGGDQSCPTERAGCVMPEES